MGRCIIVIPAYNEEKTIGEVVKGARKYGEVLVVNDCSTDGTARVAENAGAQVVTNEKNKGYEETLNRGVQLASEKADMILIMDADNQHDPDDIPLFLEALKNADLVVGIRPHTARISESMYAIATKLKLGINDPLCGFKAFKNELYKKIGYYDSMKAVGTEFMFAAKKKGAKIVQIPIHLQERSDTARFEKGIKLKAEWRIFSAMVKTNVKYLW